MMLWLKVQRVRLAFIVEAVRLGLTTPGWRPDMSERRDEERRPSSPQPDAGRTVETTAQHAPRPEELRVTSSEWRPGPTLVLGDGPTMPMRSLSDDNHDRVWIAQGDHVEAMGVGDTPQEAAIEYARAVADLLRPCED